MTHTLHRRGDIESLHEDYVMLIMPAKGVNLDGSQEKMRHIWNVLSHYESDLTNFGNISDGNSHRTSLQILKRSNSRIIHAVFKDWEILKACLKELKDRDFGVSVVISGLYDNVEKLCSEIGLSPHTVEYSLGTHGNTERLPDEKVLEITTMCGHGMISTHLVIHMLNEIEEDKVTCEEAAKNLSKVCECGIFNPYRAEKLLKKLTSRAKTD